MLAIDTNVLVRLFVDDSGAPHQCRMARELVSGNEPVLISHIALTETVWVLHRSYRLSKARIAHAVESVLIHPRYRVDDRELFAAALDIFQSAGIEFTDAVVLARSRNAGCALHTFDRALSRLDGAKLLA